MATSIGRTPQTFLVTRYRAAAGDPDAQYRLDYWYTYGQGVEQDEAEGVRWFRLAADQGQASAQVNLGSMYTDRRPHAVSRALERLRRLVRRIL